MPYTGPLTAASLSALNGLNSISSNDSLSSTSNSPTSCLSINSSSSSLDMHFTPQPSAIDKGPSSFAAPVMPVPKSLFAAFGKNAKLANNASTLSPKNSDLNSSTSSLSTIVPQRTGNTPTQTSAAVEVSQMPPLLRKKSGNIVRSSLKLPLLARCNSMPVNKNVRFAAMLEDVKTFNEFERPIAVSNENSPVSTPRGNARRRANFNWNYSSEDSEDDYDDDDNEIDAAYESEDVASQVEWKITSNNIPILKTRDYSADRIIFDSVHSTTNTTLTGLVYVKNVAFDKRVSVKLTVDNWKTFSFIHGFYVSSNNYGDYDKFRFVINLSNLNFSYYDKLVNLEFCIRYEVGGETFWDSNGGSNYNLLLQKKSKPALQQFLVKKSSAAAASLIPLKSGNSSKHRQTSSEGGFMSRYSFDNVSSEYNCNDSYFTFKPSASMSTKPSTVSPALSVASTFKPVASALSVTSAPSTPTKPASIANKPRYSNKYKQKHQLALDSDSKSPLVSSASADAINTLAAASGPLSHPSTVKPSNGLYSSQSYTDLVRSYCFFKGDGVDHSLPTTFV
ncbi:carbohydrate-binding module family 21 protein [Babjeviella inositovora NRRL Y-12698]|uniref:Carbohydrate-binding module family 21 protein n=1 Tax=Babjeviella inositovora NRRL Y-12698 TaxID=984486 RepID=A0A1E3QZ20_9ASCO|nr:carbohydrate-binding module family 21 protein [Babjeviella inositovora NRRL Y-12698]ODQ82332.1 carbohydrate-binding module family 21 protein [Babjeviella inositovora NRRL Y-12698]